MYRLFSIHYAINKVASGTTHYNNLYLHRWALKQLSENIRVLLSKTLIIQPHIKYVK